MSLSGGTSPRPYRIVCDRPPPCCGAFAHRPSVSPSGNENTAHFGSTRPPPTTNPIARSSQMLHAAESMENVPDVAPSPVTVNQLSLFVEGASSLSMRVHPAAIITSRALALSWFASSPYIRHVAAAGSVVNVNSRSAVLADPGQFTAIGDA